MSWGADSRSDDPLRRAETARSVVEGVGAEWDIPVLGDWIQLVLAPSFHPEIVITVVEHGRGCRVVARTAQCNLWYLDEYKRRPEQLPSSYVPPTPTRVAVERVLGASDARRIWKAARHAQPSTPRFGKDGIGITIRHRLDAQYTEFTTWSPSRLAPERELIDALIQSIDAAGNRDVSSVITDAMRYLDLDETDGPAET